MYVTLNISNTGIRLLSVEGRRIVAWGESALSPGLVRDGLVLQPANVAEAIGALMDEKKTPRTKVIACLTGMGFTHRLVSLPRMKSSLQEEAILRAAKKEIPLPLEELYLSWQPVITRQTERDYFVVGVARHLVDAFVQTLEAAAIKSYLLDLKSLALARAANRPEAMVVSLEPDYFDIVLVAGGMPVMMRTVSPRWAGATSEDNGRQLVDELLKTVGFYNSNHISEPMGAGTPLLLTGALSADAALTQLIQSEVEYPVAPLVPPLGVPEGLPVASYATSMGLALKKISTGTTAGDGAGRFHDINIDLLSGKYRKARARPISTKAMLTALVLIAAVALMYPFYQLYGQAQAATLRLQTEFSRVDQDIYLTELAAKKAAEMETDISAITGEIRSLSQEHGNLLSRRGDFTRDLRLVTRVLPPGTHFTSIKMTEEYLILEGETDNLYSVVAYALALEGTGRFPEVRISSIDEAAAVPVEGNGTAAPEVTGSLITFSIALSK